jgi:hypothetical protein
VSKVETISRLEALLARVRRRAAEPHRPSAAALLEATAPVGPVVDEPFDDEPDQPTLPPPPVSAAEPDIRVDVDLQPPPAGGIIAVTALADEARVADALESMEQLVAARPAAPESQADVVRSASFPTAPAEPQVEPVGIEEPGSDEGQVEEAPASSRRPVAPEPEERLAQIAFGAEEPQPARHTPPPESGRLPAASGAEEFDAHVTGTRGVSSMEEDRPTESPPQGPASRVIVPHATRAQLAGSEGVADVVGGALDPVPSTFIALLERSLAL